MSKLNKLSKDIENYPEFFYVLGAFEGDGYFNIKHGKVQIGVIDIDFLEEIKRIFNKYSPETRIKIVKHTEAKNNSKSQMRINLCCVEFFNRGYHKLIPRTLEEKRYYLKGLMDAEGSVGRVHREIKSKNGNIYNGKDKWLRLSQKDTNKLNLWASWLNEFGVEINKLYRDDGRSYLDIRKNESIKNYYKEIGFAITRKQKKLKEIVVNLKKSPLSEEDAKKVIDIYTKTNFSATLIGKMFDRTKFAITRRLKFNNIWINKDLKQISAKDIDIAEGILGRELDFKIPNHMLLKYDVKNINTSKIKSIIFDEEEEFVDLETREYSNFFLDNGILSHNSTIATQVGYFCAWLIAGGEMDLRRDSESNKFINPVVTKKPIKSLNFTLKNLAFSPEDLMRLGRTLPKNSVIVYDEGRTGLDAKTTMSALNRMLEDFFQECGQYNHVILIVLPDFFKLHSDYAVSRSYFLIDVFLDENFSRGYFNFYNEVQKDFLYNHGKKKLGILSKYNAGYSSFSGRFTSWFPFEKKKYDLLKRLALKKKELTGRRTKIKEQRDALMSMYKEETEDTLVGVAKKMTEALGKTVGQDVIKHGIQDYRIYLEKKEEYDELMKEQDEYDDLDEKKE